MIEKLGHAAERLATTISLSRRGFLQRLGQGALGVAVALLAFPRETVAQSSQVTCCYYLCHPAGNAKKCATQGRQCQRSFSKSQGGVLYTCLLADYKSASSCAQC